MALLPEIDEEKTIANVRDFFEHDFKRLQNMAHISYVSIKSPIISGMPTGSSVSNYNDDKLSNYSYARKTLDDVLRACEHMSYPYRDVLELRYFKGLSWLEVTDRLGYSTSRGHQLINDSFLQFAEAFSDIYDYRVFK
ncbi:RNA polymerase subunit sigma-70 [Weissella viridescens]|uniref:ArpU family phage packaging/lysis transcriptional regulator n=1 Tax=Weissella viridescens TaxID=1629 RepID=UPI001D07684A|nr:ArpU family phage packaging/lysis transcriptional regulator [Weissella viridescens]MCB6839660.1 RNA polymerase subunit sigma-70 [Weissella viridescens]MCB6846391.1 RNA polymerase subunit sigma-70 [Weissella viridescens]